MTDEKVTVADLDALVADIFEQRKKIEESEAATSLLNIELTKMKAKALNYLKSLGRDDFKSPMGTIRASLKWRVNLPASDEDKAKLFEHLRERGLFDRYATVNSQSLNSLFMADWEAAKEEGRGMEFKMPGIGEPKSFEDLNVRKA